MTQCLRFSLLALLAGGGVAPSFGQPNVLGRWDKLMDGPTVVQWRQAERPGDKPNPYKDATHPTETVFPNMFSIHAMLLYNGGNPRVMMWGQGKGFDGPDVRYGSYLMWDPMLKSGPGAYGVVGYVIDPNESLIGIGLEIGADLHCVGDSALTDGRVLVTAGLRLDEMHVGEDLGVKSAFIFDPVGDGQIYEVGRWTSATGIQIGSPLPWLVENRWYPTQIRLPDNERTLIVGGLGQTYDEPGQPTKKYSKSNEMWTVPIGGTPSRVKLCNHLDTLASSDPPCCDSPSCIPEYLADKLGNGYPWIYLVSRMQSVAVQGLITYCGPAAYVYTWHYDAPVPPQPDAIPWHVVAVISGPPWPFRDYGTSLLLPNPNRNPQTAAQQVLSRVVRFAGRNGSNEPVNATADVIDFGPDTPTRSLFPMPDPIQFDARMHHASVILPDGSIFLTGGDRGSPTDHVRKSWICNPEGNPSWTEVAALPSDVFRVYHSILLLLPDASVLSAGSQATGAVNDVPTIFNPPYLFNSDGTMRAAEQRPMICNICPTSLAYGNEGQQFDILFFNPAGPIVPGDGTSVVLVRPGASTHSTNFEQRLIRCKFELTSRADVLRITPPFVPEIAQPGWYMLFLVDKNGIPSVASWVHLQLGDLHGCEEHPHLWGCSIHVGGDF